MTAEGIAVSDRLSRVVVGPLECLQMQHLHSGGFSLTAGRCKRGFLRYPKDET